MHQQFAVDAFESLTSEAPDTVWTVRAECFLQQHTNRRRYIHYMTNWQHRIITFQLKRYYSLLIYVHSKREQKVISNYQICSVFILTLLFWE